MLGLSALLVSRVQRTAHEQLANTTAARLHAQAALRLGMLEIERDPNWRFSFDSESWFSNRTLAEGTCSLTVIDPTDGDISDAAADPLVMTGIGRVGQAVHRTEITIAPLYRGYDCLRSAMHSGDDVHFQNANVTADHTISANDDITAEYSYVSASVSAGDGVSGWTFSGMTEEDADSRDLPSSAEVLRYYQENGTEISVSDLPTQFHSIIFNGDFETTEAPWQAHGASVAADSVYHFSGNSSLMVQDRSSKNSGTFHDVSGLLISGRTYRVSFAVRQTTVAESFYVHLATESSGSGMTVVSAGPFTPGVLNQWVSGNLNVQPYWSGTLTTANLYITTSGTPPTYGSSYSTTSTPGKFYLDDVQMRETSTVRNIEHVLLSPESNPFGDVNPQGIYVIDLNGSRIVVRDCRIFGTLVLIDPADSSEIGDRGSICMQPADPRLPVLVVTSGDISINPSGRGLAESAIGVNLNPQHAPFDGIGSDSDTDDTFGSGITGLIYGSHQIYFSGSNSLHGAVMAGNDLEITGTLSLIFDSRYYRNPPPGFSGPEKIRLLLGSARRVAD